MLTVTSDCRAATVLLSAQYGWGSRVENQCRWAKIRASVRAKNAAGADAVVETVASVDVVVAGLSVVVVVGVRLKLW